MENLGESTEFDVCQSNFISSFSMLKNYLQKLSGKLSQNQELREIMQDVYSQIETLDRHIQDLVKLGKDTQRALAEMKNTLLKKMDEQNASSQQLLLAETGGIKEELNSLKLMMARNQEKAKKQTSEGLNDKRTVISLTNYQCLSIHQIAETKEDVKGALDFDGYTINNYKATIDIQKQLKQMTGIPGCCQQKFIRKLRYKPGGQYEYSTEDRVSQMISEIDNKVGLLVGKNEMDQILYLLLDFSEFKLQQYGTVVSSSSAKRMSKVNKSSQNNFQQVNRSAICLIKNEDGQQSTSYAKNLVAKFENKDIVTRKIDSPELFYFSMDDKCYFDVYTLE